MADETSTELAVIDGELVEPQTSIEQHNADDLARIASADPELIRELADTIAAADNARTLTEYAKDFAIFATFCDGLGVNSLPASPATVAAFVADQARTLKPSTVTRRASAVSITHRNAGEHSPVQHPDVKRALKGVRKKAAADPKKRRRQASPLTLPQLRRAIDALDRTTTIGKRDAALLLVGFAGAMRRSEIVGLRLCDLELIDGGYRVAIYAAKTAAAGEAQHVAIPYGKADPSQCPVAAVQAWIAELGDVEPDAYLFRSVDIKGRIGVNALTDGSVSRIVKKAVKRIDLDPTSYSGHSLRAGFATTAGTAGVELRHIMAVTRHKSHIVAEGYVRDGALMSDGSAVNSIGL